MAQDPSLKKDCRTILVSSMPQTYTGGESYPDGDPLDTKQRVLIFATERDDQWFSP